MTLIDEFTLFTQISCAVFVVLVTFESGNLKKFPKIRDLLTVSVEGLD